jgi:hypothetical protein
LNPIQTSFLYRWFFYCEVFDQLYTLCT